MNKCGVKFVLFFIFLLISRQLQQFVDIIVYINIVHTLICVIHDNENNGEVFDAGVTDDPTCNQELNSLLQKVYFVPLVIVIHCFDASLN